jgi:hypothetical protein
MSAISRILLPVDFSPRGAGAARYVAALAQHVIQPFVWTLPSVVEDGGRFELELMRDVEERRSASSMHIAHPIFAA